MSATAKLREIEILGILSLDVRNFRDNCYGHIQMVLSRSANLVSEGQGVYEKMESKRNQIQEKLEHAQQAYNSCMRCREDDEDDYDPCASERNQVEYYSDLLQEISVVCSQAQGSLSDMKRESEGLQNICYKARADIESGVSGATSALSGIRSNAEEYAHVKAPASSLTIPTGANNGFAAQSGSDNDNFSKQEPEKVKPLFEIPENLSGDYSAVETGTGALFKDRNGQKIVRIKKNGNTAVLSGFDTAGGDIADFPVVENILQHNRISTVSCWVTVNELEFYRQAGFSVKEKSEGGFIVAKNYQ